MNKSQLVDKIATEAGLTKVQANAALAAFIDAVTNTLKSGDKLTLVGFGTFSAGTRAARVGRNPKTGAPLNIAAAKVAKFKPGKELEETING